MFFYVHSPSCHCVCQPFCSADRRQREQFCYQQRRELLHTGNTIIIMIIIVIIIISSISINIIIIIIIIIINLFIKLYPVSGFVHHPQLLTLHHGPLWRHILKTSWWGPHHARGSWPYRRGCYYIQQPRLQGEAGSICDRCQWKTLCAIPW